MNIRRPFFSFLLLKDGIKYIYSIPDSGLFLEAFEDTLVMAAVNLPRQSIPTLNDSYY